MVKPGKTFFLTLALLGLAAMAFTQEEITLTTYYPSPYGSYDELRTNKMAVGSTAAMPANDGDLNVSGKVREGENALVPAGAIILWTGAACPPGYARFTGIDDRFLVSGAAYSASAGGVNNITLTSDNLPRHKHNVDVNDDSGSHDHFLAMPEGSSNGSPIAEKGGLSGTVSWERDRIGPVDLDLPAASRVDVAKHDHIINEEYFGKVKPDSFDNRPAYATVLLCQKN